MPVRLHFLALAWRLVLRDWRSGELTILAIALVIAVAGTSTVTLLGHRLTRTVESQAAEFLAADLAVSSHDPLPASWMSVAESMGLSHAETVEFHTVVVEGDTLQLCGVKATGDNYPLRGSLRISAGDVGQGEVLRHGPPPGEAWVDQRVLTSLSLSLGDTITVGELGLPITRLILSIPDNRGDLFGLSPQILIHLHDLPTTKVIQPGSHAHYYALYAGEQGAIATLKGQLKSELKSVRHIVDIHEDRPELGRTLSRAERYLGLSSIAIVIIAGVAIAMSARRYTARHYDLTAMLKCLGASQREVLIQHLTQYLIIGLGAGIIGALLGYAAQFAVVDALKPLLPHELVAPSWTALGFGPAIGLLVLMGFALPTVLSIRHLPPLRVLRRDLAPMAASGWFVYGLALATIASLTWFYTSDARLMSLVLSTTLGVVAVAGLAIYLSIRSLRRLIPRHSRAWRFGLRNLTRSPGLTAGQTLAFCLTLAAMLLVLLVRTELIGEWRRQLPADVPNHFAMNLMDSDLAPFRQFLIDRSVPSSEFYSIVKGRLTHINGADVHRVATRESEGEAAINRDLNLTYAADVPEDNRIVEGKWWDSSIAGAQLSVEEKLAASLGIKIGDSLRFTIADLTLEAPVVNIRHLRWDTMKPNFYVVFNPGVLESRPHTFLGSFHLSEAQQPMLAELSRQFPVATVLQVDALLKQLQAIVREVTLAVEFVLAFALMAGFAVLAATARSSLDDRIREHALLRVMGAHRNLLRKTLLIEFGSLGLLAGFMAAALTDLMVWMLFRQLFDLEARWHWEIWLAAPMTGAVAVGLAGYWFTRRAIENSPAVVLRDT
jgi:putative ABC transport system permease protein